MPKIAERNKKSTELIAAEKKALKALHLYTRRAQGIQAELCRKTGIYPGVMSKMAGCKGVITFERAILLEIATDGELKAEFLCPASAEVFIKFKALIVATVATV